ncbi:MAG: DNA translocase FtsK 4TM domain-containing protein, partial [Alphaproteobacteria bacterium]
MLNNTGPAPMMVFNDTIDEFSDPRGSRLQRLGKFRLVLTGFGLLGCALFLIVSLLTWHVADPSFSHATDAAAGNLMGFAGAAAADIVMQFLGLGATALVALLFIPGINYLRARPFRHAIRQIGYAILGTLFAVTALACLPVIGNWPLPTGLGGAVG